MILSFHDTSAQYYPPYFESMHGHQPCPGPMRGPENGCSSPSSGTQKQNPQHISPKPNTPDESGNYTNEQSAGTPSLRFRRDIPQNLLNSGSKPYIKQLLNLRKKSGQVRKRHAPDSKQPKHTLKTGFLPERTTCSCTKAFPQPQPAGTYRKASTTNCSQKPESNP